MISDAEFKVTLGVVSGVIPAEFAVYHVADFCFPIRPIARSSSICGWRSSSLSQPHFASRGVLDAAGVNEEFQSQQINSGFVYFGVRVV